ncbi:hypothetical protein FISHEDRAFT_50946, partial [Fistulina hepatica ATCC 64428]
CTVSSGKWFSQYDGVEIDQSSKVDIDHVVPLKEAWVSGARNWDPDNVKRTALANDITNPQLLSVSQKSNRMKDPAEWVPTRESYVCTYVRAWVQVKYNYGLSIDMDEKDALHKYLEKC